MIGLGAAVLLVTIGIAWACACREARARNEAARAARQRAAEDLRARLFAVSKEFQGLVGTAARAHGAPDDLDEWARKLSEDVGKYPRQRALDDLRARGLVLRVPPSARRQ